MTSSRPQQPAPTLEGYSFVEKLGRGGFGEVWLAQERSTKARVAIKIIPKIRGLAGEEPPNIIKVNETVLKGAGEHLVRMFHVHEAEGPPPAFFVVMEHMEHGTIADLLPSSHASREIRRGIPVEQALKLTASLLEGLQLLHENGLTHYDVKPGNIFLASKNHSTVKLGDYGLLKPSDSPAPNAGTASYRPPDCGNAVPDRRADIYAAGAVLFELIFNRDPQDSADWLYRDNRESKTPLPPAVQAVIAKAMHVLPERRYQSAREMLADVNTLLTDNPSWGARRRGMVAGLALLLVAVACGVFFLPRFWREDHAVVVISGKAGREEGGTVSRVRTSDAAVIWSRNLADSRRVLTIADGKGGYNVLVDRAGALPMVVCLNGATGEEIWRHEGELGPSPHHSYADARRVLYANTIAHPNGPPNLCGSAAPDILLFVKRTETWEAIVLNGATGVEGIRVSVPFRINGVGWLPTTMGGTAKDYDIMLCSDTAGLRRIGGRDGKEVWRRDDLPHLYGISAGDLNGDGVGDFIGGNHHYSDRLIALSGADGTTIWETPYGAFDLVGNVQIVEGSGDGKDIVVGAQMARDGGVRRYRAADGGRVWTCGKAYDNNAIRGIIGRKDGGTIVSLWRHKSRFVAFDLADGRMLWEGVPQMADGMVGVPDMTGDGNDDLIVIMGDGFARLYDGLTGIQVEGFPPIPATADIAYLP